MSKKELLVIHCTDTYPEQVVTAKELHQWHIIERGWEQYGYNDLVELPGHLINLVPFDLSSEVDPWEIANGAYGVNYKSQHVCYVGGRNYSQLFNMNRAQAATMEIYVKYTILRHPSIMVAGHYHFNEFKTCPNFDVEKWLESIGINEVNIYRNSK